MKFSDQKQLLWQTGHFRDPDHPDAWNVQKDDLDSLQPDDQAFVDAVASYQDWFGQQLDLFALSFHGRTADHDGEVGPATDLLFSQPRCYHPDFEVPIEDDPVMGALWARAEANFPTSCRHGLRLGRNFATLPGMTAEQTDGAWWAMAHNLTEPLSDVTINPTLGISSRSGHHGHARLEAMRGGILAYQYLAVGRCNVTLDGAYNSNVRWNSRSAATVLTHEYIHFLGLNHVNDPAATMFPSIHQASLARFGFPNITDIRGLIRLGYQAFDNWQVRQLPEGRLFLPRDQQPPPDPPPPPPPPPDPDDPETEIYDVEGQVMRFRDSLTLTLHRK